MRWIRFSSGGKTVYGILEGDRIVEVAGDPFSGHERTGRTHLIADVKIEIPVIPPTFYAAGRNYVVHTKEMLGAEHIPKQPDVAYRGPGSLIATGESVVIPRISGGALEYEGELVAVIGRKARNLSEREALGCVLGYTIGNDVSERNWQRSDRTNWRAKNSDTFNPMGPWIETDVKLDALETRVRLNGVEQICFPTNDMLFGVATFISTITRHLTLYPRDVLWMGTDGVSPQIRAGDIVEVEISGIGTLRNPFVAEAPE